MAGGRARQDLEGLIRVIEEAVNTTGLTIETKMRLVVTDDLRRTVRSVANGYGFDADIETKGLPVLGKNLYARSSQALEGTVILHEDLWDNDNGDLMLARYQLSVAQVMQGIIAGRRRAEGSSRTMKHPMKFQEELEWLAGEVLDGHDAQRAALALVSPFCSATDDQGNPAPPVDYLASAYLDQIGVLLKRLGEVVRDRVQPYRERRSALEDILPAACPVLRELTLLLGNTIGMSSERLVEWIPEHLDESPGFREFLGHDWTDLVKALLQQDEDEALQTLVGVSRNILARMGLYVDDHDDGRMELIVGTPSLIPTEEAGH